MRLPWQPRKYRRADDSITAITAARLDSYIERDKAEKADIRAVLVAHAQATALASAVASKERGQMLRRLVRLEMVYYFGMAIIAVLAFLGTEFGQKLAKTVLQ